MHFSLFVLLTGFTAELLLSNKPTWDISEMLSQFYSQCLLICLECISLTLYKPLWHQKRQSRQNCGMIIPVKWANSLRMWGPQNCMSKHKLCAFSHVCSWLKKGNGNTKYCSAWLRMVGVIFGEREDFFRREISINPESCCAWPLCRTAPSWPRASQMWWMGQSCCLSTFLPSLDD